MEEEEANFGPGNPSLEERASDRRVEIDADGEELNFGPGSPSLEERASDRGIEIEAEGFEESGIDGEECSENGDEARVPKIRRAPRGPTQLEREQHEALHLPYRDWCGHCVRGAGEKTPRRRKGFETEDDKKKVLRMVLIYHFMIRVMREMANTLY